MIHSNETPKQVAFFDLPHDYEVRVGRTAARLYHHGKLLHEELYLRPEMQFQALQSINIVIENIKAGASE